MFKEIFDSESSYYKVWIFYIWFANKFINSKTNYVKREKIRWYHIKPQSNTDEVLGELFAKYWMDWY